MSFLEPLISSLDRFEEVFRERWDVGNIDLLEFENGVALVMVTDFLLVEDSTWYWWRDGTVEKSGVSIEEQLLEHFKGARVLYSRPDREHDSVEVFAIVLYKEDSF